MITFKFQVSFSPTLRSHLTDDCPLKSHAQGRLGWRCEALLGVPHPVCLRRRLRLPSGLGTAADDSYFDAQVQRSVAFPSVPGEAGSWEHQAREALGPSRKPRRGALGALTAGVGGRGAVPAFGLV